MLRNIAEVLEKISEMASSASQEARAEAEVSGAEASQADVDLWRRKCDELTRKLREEEAHRVSLQSELRVFREHEPWRDRRIRIMEVFHRQIEDAAKWAPDLASAVRLALSMYDRASCDLSEERSKRGGAGPEDKSVLT